VPKVKDEGLELRRAGEGLAD
jgi:hypothetical protein